MTAFVAGWNGWSTERSTRCCNRTAAKAVSFSAVEKVKSDLLEKIQGLEEGRATIGNEQLRGEVDELVEGLERMNPIETTLDSNLVDGSWTLLYSTSDVILGTNLPPGIKYVQGSNKQIINTESLSGTNQVRVSIGGVIQFDYSIALRLTPKPPQRCLVKFETFKLGPVNIPAPSAAAGFIDITYIDDDIRITRGSKSNLFILKRD